MKSFIGIALFSDTNLAFQGFGNLSPAISCLVLGLIVVLIAFGIAMAMWAKGKANKFRKNLNETTAFVLKEGVIDAENVDGLNDRLRDLPRSVSRGWGAFMEQQTGYPSDYITERDVLGTKKSHADKAGGLILFDLISAVILCICAILVGIGCGPTINQFAEAGLPDMASVAKLATETCAGIGVPLLIYVILRAVLALIYRQTNKKIVAAFRDFQDALDNCVAIFKEHEDEFVAENIEEINAAIEEILANKLESSEIEEIVTAPKISEEEREEEIQAEEVEELPEEEPVEEEEYLPEDELLPEEDDEEYEPEPEEPIEEPVYEEPVEEEPVYEEPVVEEEPVTEEEPVEEMPVEEPISEEVAADEPMTEEQRGQHLLELVYLADRASKDPDMEREQLAELAEYLYSVMTSGNYDSPEEQEIFGACLEILSGAFYA